RTLPPRPARARRASRRSRWTCRARGARSSGEEAMRALAFDGHRAALVERPDPKPSPDEALVRVSVAGVCRTDLEIVRGYMGFRGVLGHEFVGQVLDGPPEWRDQRVVGEINFACGRCPTCARNLRRHCPQRRVMGIHEADGAFAEAVLVPVENLHRVPDGVADE